jgi:hypothetical protein
MDRTMEFPTEWAIPRSDEDYGRYDSPAAGTTPPQRPPVEAPPMPEEY